MSSRPSATITSVTPVANEASASPRPGRSSPGSPESPGGPPVAGASRSVTEMPREWGGSAARTAGGPRWPPAATPAPSSPTAGSPQRWHSPRWTPAAAAGPAGVDAYRHGPGQPGPVPGQGQRLLQATELIDQAVGGGIRPGPHPAPGDVMHLLGRHLAPAGDLAGKVRINVVKPGIDFQPFFFTERARRAEH